MSAYNEEPPVDIRHVVRLGIVSLLVATGLMAGCAYVKPQYDVYSAKMEGEAELAKASQNRQIIVQEAEANKTSEILRAEGTAKANAIIGNSLKENSDYLRWMWLNNISNEKNKTVIYTPTDGMIPVLETGRGSQK